MSAVEISGSLREAFDKLKGEPPEKCQVYYLKKACEEPYRPNTGEVNHQVTVFNTTATCVGVGKMADGSVTDLLVSDSFGPCVPVIAIGNGKKSLAHFQGSTLSLVKTISDNCNANLYSKIIVIQRELPERQIEVSNELFKIFAGFMKPESRLHVELVKVPLNATMGDGLIGVIVIGSSVLVYPTLPYKK